ncbi:hypothetical protein GCM10009804_38290 [Kribbella hippodromi]|uniref:Uncharacterized protein n=1 Tax=Kribbella hippodromi TaxID=434347 RepID=A0ABN2DKW8_9ACTN
MMLYAGHHPTGSPVQPGDVYAAEVEAPDRHPMQYQRRLMADGDTTRADRVHHRVHLTEVLQAVALPRRQSSQVEQFRVLTAPDLLPPTVPQAPRDLVVSAPTGKRLAATENTTLLLSNHPEPLIHPPSIHRPAATPGLVFRPPVDNSTRADIHPSCGFSTRIPVENPQDGWITKRLAGAGGGDVGGDYLVDWAVLF